VNSPKSQFTLAELMGLVALSAVGLALLTATSFVVLGIGVLVVLPGFVIERAKGGTGIIGGVISGCALPASISFPAALLQLYITDSPFSDYLNLLPALYLLFVLCLVWSGFFSSILYLVDRRLQGQSRASRPAPRLSDAGIRFLPDDDHRKHVPPEAGIRYLGSDAAPNGGPDR
jgi:hypothetical protein